MTTIVTRADKGLPLSTLEMDTNLTNLNTDKAELASPTFTGTPAAPTATTGTNTTQLATTAFTKTEIAADRPYSDTNPIMDSTAAQGTSPNVSRQDHVHPSDTTKANLSGATFTGGVSATTGLTVKSVATGSNDGNVVSGTYTPTSSGLINCNTVIPGVHNWLRVGNIVTVSGNVTVSATAAPQVAYFYLSTPVNSAFTTLYEGNGGGTVNTGSNFYTPIVGVGSVSNTILLGWYPVSTSAVVIRYTMTYRVI